MMKWKVKLLIFAVAAFFTEGSIFSDGFDRRANTESARNESAAAARNSDTDCRRRRDHHRYRGRQCAFYRARQKPPSVDQSQTGRHQTG